MSYYNDTTYAQYSDGRFYSDMAYSQPHYPEATHYRDSGSYYDYDTPDPVARPVSPYHNRSQRHEGYYQPDREPSSSYHEEAGARSSYSPHRDSSPYHRDDAYHAEPPLSPESPPTVSRRPVSEWASRPVKATKGEEKPNTSQDYTKSSLSPFPQPSSCAMPRGDSTNMCRPELEEIRPVSRAERRARNNGVEDDAFSLALSEVTTVTPEHLLLSLAEELVMLKAGDKPKFSKHDLSLDAICSCALLLDLVAQKRVGPDSTQTVNPRKISLRVLDDTPTGSKLADSALSNLRRKPRQPPTIQYWIKKASPDLCGALLWRLVKKGKLAFDPRTFGADRYPVKAFAELNEIRERVVAVVERTAEAPPLKDMFLAFLYYLPTDASDKVFSDRDDDIPEVAHMMSKAVALAIQESNSSSDHFI